MGPKLIKERLLRTTGDGLSWNRVRGLEKQEVPAPLLTFLGKEDRLEREKVQRAGVSIYAHRPQHSQAQQCFLSSGPGKGERVGDGKKVLELEECPRTRRTAV